MASQLQQEIESQPEMLARLLDRELDRIGTHVVALPACDYVLIAARGSSDHAAVYAKYAWAALAGYPVALATPSLYTLYGTPPRLNGALVVGISQSGQSPDITAVVEEARRQGRPTLAITNDADSPLAMSADFVVELHVGQERSVAATKTYTAQLAVMAAYAACWSGDQARLDELRRMPEAIHATLNASADLAERAERYRYMDVCTIVGRGYNYATSFELALKLKELTYVMATSYSSADFRHGPIATVESGSPVVLVMPTGESYNDMLELADELERRNAELLVISERAAALARARTPLPMHDGVPEWLSPIPAIVPGQLLALHLALAKGLDP
ncbi:MAG TPA: SIS domain-containing protein, partial [Ktedonobacterales bacterium]|nr:SIS domain-containing protein [Ktedonobacterales bacterium]